MVEASFSDVVEVVLIILLIYFGFKIIMRWFGPLLLRYILKRIGKKFERKFGEFDKEQKKAGEVTLDMNNSNSKKSNKDVGEYIDYEEID